MLNSLRTRLTLIFVGLTIIPLVIVGSLITSRGFSTLQDQAVQRQEDIAERTSLNIESFFAARQAELTALTDIYGLDTLSPEEQRAILSTLISERRAYYELALLDANAQETLRITRGEVVTQSNLVSRADVPVIQNAIETHQVSYGDVYFNDFARDRQITIAVPIENLFTGEIGNILVAEVRFQEISDAVLRELNLDEGQDVFITSSDGVILAHRDPNLVIKETSFQLPAEQGRTTGLSNDDVILGMHPVQLANQNLVVVAETDYSTATALANDLFRISAIITVVTLIVASLIVILSVSRIVNPITNMAKVATKVQQGDLSARANEQGAGEIATLGRAFNKMTSELQQTLEGLRGNVEALEASNRERANLIKELQAAKRIADENSRLKSEFLATMSHELRTPMNAIEGFTSIILKRMAGTEYNDKAERYLYKIQNNSRRLLGLINDFLDLSRIESGRFEAAYLPYSPTEMAKEWEDSLGILAEERGLELAVSVDPTLPNKIYGDEEALSKIAINLVGNAIKFTEKGKVTVELKKRDSNLELEVTDTGIGIPPHARDFIFDEFRQVDQSSKRQHGGTGLGLAIVQKLAREMGGTVTLQSEVGVGSTFTVLIPIQTQEPTTTYGAA